MLSTLDLRLHSRAVQLCRQRRLNEWKILEALQKIDHAQLFKMLGHNSLFVYAVKELGFTESVAYNFIFVARKAVAVPLLNEALRSQQICASRAGRIASVIDDENAEHLISFARKHTQRETDFEAARWGSKCKTRDRSKIVGDDQVQIVVTLTRAQFEALQRVQSLEAQKQKPAAPSNALAASLDCYLEHNDPVRKAARAQQRAAKSSKLCSNKDVPTPTRRRVRLKAHEKHAVHSRDQGRCTHVNAKGERCGSDRFIHIHHVQAVSHGGSNAVENLSTLCAFHHDLVHQMELPIESLAAH